jgi:hypothetical protein
MTPDNSSPGNAVTDRIAVDPILPVPHTATRRIRVTLVGLRSGHSYRITPSTGFAAVDGLHFQHYVTIPQFFSGEDGGAFGRLVGADGTTRSQPRPTTSRGRSRWKHEPPEKM